jgi:phosphoglycolate phosphatase-like HAD superfamily hydrolase
MRRRSLLRSVLAAIVLSLGPAAPATGQDGLPSWNEGRAKQAIMDFVRRVTVKGSAEYVPPAERIATFDNDGTLWAEQPVYFQFLFAVDRVRALAPRHPEWKDREPFASLLKDDVKGALAGGEKALLEVVAATHSGMTTTEFEQIVKTWLGTAKHPRFQRPYADLVYPPMLELLADVRAQGFKTFIVSGGGVEFMRAFAERVYGIPPSRSWAARASNGSRCATARRAS